MFTCFLLNLPLGDGFSYVVYVYGHFLFVIFWLQFSSIISSIVQVQDFCRFFSVVSYIGRVRGFSQWTIRGPR